MRPAGLFWKGVAAGLGPSSAYSQPDRPVTAQDPTSSSVAARDHLILPPSSGMPRAYPRHDGNAPTWLPTTLEDRAFPQVSVQEAANQPMSHNPGVSNH